MITLIYGQGVSIAFQPTKVKHAAIIVKIEY